MEFLTKDVILAMDDRNTEVVEVPEWDGKVTIKTMSGRDRGRYDNYLQKHMVGKGKSRVVDMELTKAALIVQCAVDTKGELMFSHSQIPMLAQKSSAALERLSQVAMKLNGLGEGAEEDAKADLQPEANSELGSGSPPDGDAQ